MTRATKSTPAVPSWLSAEWRTACSVLQKRDEPTPSGGPRVVSVDDDGGVLLQDDQFPKHAETPPMSDAALFDGIPDDIASEIRKVSGPVPASSRDALRHGHGVGMRRGLLGELADHLTDAATLAERDAVIDAEIEASEAEVSLRIERLQAARDVVAAWDDEGPDPAPSHVPVQRAEQRLRAARQAVRRLEQERYEIRVEPFQEGTSWQGLSGGGRLQKAQMLSERRLLELTDRRLWQRVLPLIAEQTAAAERSRLEGMLASVRRHVAREEQERQDRIAAERERLEDARRAWVGDKAGVSA